jgi:transcription-repair coupling factor (superfamily II helicase)
MQLTGLIEHLIAQPEFRTHAAHIANHNAPWHIIRAARPFVVAGLARIWPAPVIYITARIKRTFDVAGQLPVWLGDDAPIYRFGEPASQFYERAPWGESAIRGRVEALHALAQSDSAARQPVIITSARALLQRTLPFRQFTSATQHLQLRQRVNLNKLVAHWIGLGYEPVTTVIEQGQFSRRGGVLDIFPVSSYQPIRIEFWDDEIDSIRLFDASTQRTIQQLQTAVIPPAREAFPEAAPAIANHLRPWFDSLPPDGDLARDRQRLEAGVPFAMLEHYLPYVTHAPSSLLGYAPADSLVIIEDEDDLRTVQQDLLAQANAARDKAIAANLLPPDFPPPHLTPEHLNDALAGFKTVRLTSAAGDNLLWFSPGQRHGGQIKTAIPALRTHLNAGGSAVIVSQQAARITETWYQQGIDDRLPMVNDLPEQPVSGSAVLVNGTLQEGWTLALGGRLSLITDAELFGWGRPEQRRRKVTRPARLPESDHAAWTIGDYVVHVDYGIGVFNGTVTRTLDGISREYLEVRYGGGDMVYVPIHQADRLTRYIGVDDKPPTLHRLGQQDWIKASHRARKAAEDEARELLDIYAQRAATHGHAFSIDNHWQHELEASFPYVETEDQLRAISEVKADMERPMPMDRLVCGDVGYGKTEVAVRAAFKAVADGKQVAVLVPTTILAQQHYETFANRMAAFPVRIEHLSRFRTAKEQERALPHIASGEVDIVIGTHRILSDDIQFKNLGLVIIDEEQRFGVKQKEHFKRLRAQVDILTLTATPIPRTLYMTLTGVRDISMIQTPPEERLPVITHVGPFEEGLVRQAVLRELERGGQVFVVHNRIGSMDFLRQQLEDIVPEARIITAHGQMNPRMLESIMAAFSRGEYDILLATAIIENGIDIPNVNTLIVDHADWFGLSQLYQLRGRVGRGAQQAYAYFFSADGKLTQEAFARLETLAENTQLGAGFQIAMRDLEIRGAGDILSTRQTGHVAAIGLNLYTQLLAQAVNRLKGQKPDAAALAVSAPGLQIDLPLQAYLPEGWITDMSLRLQLYRRIGGLSRLPNVEALREELRDRFGPLPLAADDLLYQMEVKLLAQLAGATAVQARRGVLHIKLPYLPDIDREALAQTLGDDIAVTRVSVEILMDKDKLWRIRLTDVLERLATEYDALQAQPDSYGG